MIPSKQTVRGLTLYACSLFLLSGLCIAQGAPVAPIGALYENDLNVNYMLVVKNGVPDLGNGVDLTSTHYFTQHLGAVAEAETLFVTQQERREYAVRMGPTYRFRAGDDVQPFVRFLAGFSTVRSTDSAPSRPPKYGGSFLLGGGLDIRLKGPLFARSTMDLVDDWGPGTRFGRGTVGFVLKFGNGRR